MAKTKKPSPKTPFKRMAVFVTERNILLVLAVTLAVCIGVLVLRSQRNSTLIDPVTVEQTQNQ